MHLKRLCRVSLAVLVILVTFACAGGELTKPNIIFILTDDLGFGDVGTFFQNSRQASNNPAKPWQSTPKLDAMAAQGIKLTDHYCPAAVCAPSRASLLLGVHQGHANVRDNQFDKALENNHTLATVLKAAGYQTAAIGKWGLQGKGNAPATWPAYPTRRGFDYYFGYVRHADGHEHYPKEGPHKGPMQVWDMDQEISSTLDKCYTADLFTARAKKWILDQHATNVAQPFFMYLAFDTPHATTELPTQAYPTGSGTKGGLRWLGKSGEMINTASGTIDSWYHPDYAKATYDDDGNPNTPEVPWPDVYKRYATSVRRIDDCVGDLLQLLKDLHIETNTLVVFSSDNGPSIESYLKQPFAANFFSSFGPFDGIKRDLLEGGLRVPTIAWWPGHISPGRTSSEPSQSHDWMPTFAEVAGVPVPARSDGVSLLPLLTGHGLQKKSTVYSEYFNEGKTPNYSEFAPGHRGRKREQMQAIRIGDYQGVRYNVTSHADNFEIYNLAKDPGERMNLATRPEFAALQQKMKDTVLQLRRPDVNARRPYDQELVPAVSIASLKPGITWSSYKGNFPWLPELTMLHASSTGITNHPTIAIQQHETGTGLLFTGYLDVPTDGEYTIYLGADTHALLRIHEATVIDEDFGYSANTEKSGVIRLKAGKHPFRLYYATQTKSSPSLSFSWSGPGIEKQPIPDTTFFHDGALASRASAD
ncbi:sulfatase-like hydrolase/transferase [Pedosphaera parvula]|uniref:Sulfatase n=1 Tax=Pedosphaera parvula (strain Ellin514) TaxID=320771 RepID=B9XEH6_PEDPL|nr:sulfatase-like hydrolase/transferase [Pedosphaera parvula]EEF61690.1 sulfatase [Pedosphaera parvula Ellin514]